MWSPVIPAKMRIVYDIEANNLKPKLVTSVHCIATSDLDTGRERFFGPDQIEAGLSLLDKAEVTIAHNCLGYDLRVLYFKYGFKPAGTIIDSLILSRLSNPDRAKPLGLSGQIGPHSIEAWGVRLGMAKIAHEEWQVFSEEMKQRCVVDVRINVAAYKVICEEMSK